MGSRLFLRLVTWFAFAAETTSSGHHPRQEFVSWLARKMTPAQAAAQYGVTIIEMANAWGVKRRAIEMMFYAHPNRFELIALGVKCKLTQDR